MNPTFPHPLIRTSVLESPEPEESWWWTANHLDENRSVTGGLVELRMLVRAIDGHTWPYTTAGSAVRGRWFQVLGTPEACVLEIGESWGAAMLAHQYRSGTHLIPLPRACRHWVQSVRPSELFEADEAFELGVRHVRGIPLPRGYERRPVYNPQSRNH